MEEQGRAGKKKGHISPFNRPFGANPGTNLPLGMTKLCDRSATKPSASAIGTMNARMML